MDATCADGSAFIAYVARLQWGLINVGYNGYTFFDGQNATVTKLNSFSNQSLPQLDGNNIVWQHKKAGGTWLQCNPSINEELLCSSDGDILWQCLFPKALASLSINSRPLEKSFGYVEKITITIPPWQIPIHHLHWGRFLSNDYTIIWIRWIGPLPKTIVYCNGVRYTEAEITTTQLRFSDHLLSFSNSRTLRSGTILSTVFSKFPSIAKLFPKAIMNLTENKWVSDGQVFKDEKPVSTGKIIHEFVSWK